MPRQSPTTAVATFETINISTASLCCLALLCFGRGCAFSLPRATTPGTNNGSSGDRPCFFEHVLVEHTDQLEQRRRDRHDDHERGVKRDDSTALVPPPHLFSIPAPGGNICLIVDENSRYHAVRDVCPPLSVPISQTGVVDSQVDAIGDSLFGTRFNLNNGSIRGPWCPGGGMAGPLLLRLARRPRLRGIARLLLIRTPWRRNWVKYPPASPSSLSPRSGGRRIRRRGLVPSLRRRRLNLEGDNAKIANGAAGLEVLAVTAESDGRLTVELPRYLPMSAAAEKSDLDGNLTPSGGQPATVVMQEAKCRVTGYNF